jgi:hypothetical protein
MFFFIPDLKVRLLVCIAILVAGIAVHSVLVIALGAFLTVMTGGRMVKSLRAPR